MIKEEKEIVVHKSASTIFDVLLRIAGMTLIMICGFFIGALVVDIALHYNSDDLFRASTISQLAGTAIYSIIAAAGCLVGQKILFPASIAKNLPLKRVLRILAVCCATGVVANFIFAGVSFLAAHAG